MYKTHIPAAVPFHASTRTGLSTNTDPDTGKRTQVLTTSRLEMKWEAGELQVRCTVSRVVMDSDRVQRPVQPARGAL